MLETARGWLLDQLRAAKPSFISKKPHFNFISAHCKFTTIPTTILSAHKALRCAQH